MDTLSRCAAFVKSSMIIKFFVTLYVFVIQNTRAYNVGRTVTERRTCYLTNCPDREDKELPQICHCTILYGRICIGT